MRSGIMSGRIVYLWSHCAGPRRFRCIYDGHDDHATTRRYRSDKANGKKKAKLISCKRNLIGHN